MTARRDLRRLPQECGAETTIAFSGAISADQFGTASRLGPRPLGLACPGDEDRRIVQTALARPTRRFSPWRASWIMLQHAAELAAGDGA